MASESEVIESFREQVIDKFSHSPKDSSESFGYADYIALPKDRRDGDEKPCVDRKFTDRVLGWLGFSYVTNEIDYDQSVPDPSGNPPLRPDYRVKGPVGIAFIWEDKNTTEDFATRWHEQLRRYMAGRAGYAVWCNARRILVHHFDAQGQSEIAIDVSVEALFGSPREPPDEEARASATTGLRLFRILFERERFFGFDALLRKVIVDEATFLNGAAPLATPKNYDEFIQGSRKVLEQLRLAALAQIQAAAAGDDERREQQDRLIREWIGAVDRLAQDLPPSVFQRIDAAILGMQPRLGTLHLDEIKEVLEEARPGGRKLPPGREQSLAMWVEVARQINAASRGTHLQARHVDRIGEAFTVWRERQPLSDLATEAIYAEQVAYVFFVRVLLTRVLEDKGILKRIASDGGFRAWHDLVAGYFGNGFENLQTASFMRLLTERVSTFYQHFFRQPLFDWFLPDDYLLLTVLAFLSEYSFATIGSDLLGYTYEEYIDRVARNSKGHFLTRPAVVEHMLDTMDYSGPKVIGRRLIDPACGSGSFLVHAAQRLRRAVVDARCTIHGVDEATLLSTPALRRELAREYISCLSESFVGMDIDPFGCYLAELNLLVQCLDDLHELWSSGSYEPIDSFRVFNTDSLDLPESVRDSTVITQQPVLSGFSAPTTGALVDPSYPIKARDGAFQPGFFYVICNPPYVNSRVQKTSYDYYRAVPFFREAMGRMPNLYHLFVKLGIHYLATGGRMVYIVPLTLFGDDSAQSARQLLTSGDRHPYQLVRFYRGDVLFPGVDQAVAIFGVDDTRAPALSIGVCGGRTVEDAKASAVRQPRDRVLANTPGDDAWSSVWLVSPEPTVYDVWEAARRASSGTVLSLLEFAFFTERECEGLQGDVNATHLNPLRVKTPDPDCLPIYKGESITRFAPLPMAPSDWARPQSGDDEARLPTSARSPNQVIGRLRHLAAPEDGFVLRQVARLNTRDKLIGTWFGRDSEKSFAFTNELWRFIRRPQVSMPEAQATFGLVLSDATCYLLNTFSTNNHVTMLELGRLPVPDIRQLDVKGVGALVDGILQRRTALQQDYAALDVQLPDTHNGKLCLSPDRLLSRSRLPTVPLLTLQLQGRIKFSGAPSARVRPHMRGLQVDGEALAEVIGAFFGAHDGTRWDELARTLYLPDPDVAERWLQEYRDTHDALVREWQGFVQRQGDMNEAVLDWYGFAGPLRKTIAEGLPWARP